MLELANLQAALSAAQQEAQELRAGVEQQRRRAEHAEAAVKEMRAGISLPVAAKRAVQDALRTRCLAGCPAAGPPAPLASAAGACSELIANAALPAGETQVQLSAAEEVSREQGRKRAAEVTELATTVRDMAQVVANAEAHAQAAESRAAAAVERAEATITAHLDEREQLERECAAAQEDVSNLRALLGALRESARQEQSKATKAESDARRAVAEMETTKQTWAAREEDWRKELLKMDTSRRAAESAVSALASTRMMMPGQINWPQKIFDAVAEKEERIVELEHQLEEAWATVQSLSDDAADRPIPILGLDDGPQETSAKEQEQAEQLRTLAKALRGMQRELGQERAARAQAEQRASEQAAAAAANDV